MMKLYPSSLSNLYIEWQLLGGDFTLYRSTSPKDEFEVIASKITQPFYNDIDVNLYDENVRYYYRVEGYQGDVKVSEDGPNTLVYNTLDPIANKVIEESKVALRMMNNPPVFLLLKRRVGTECPECWNPVTKKIRYANCPTCDGTGILGGYHNPIVSRISVDVPQLIMASGEEDNDRTKLSPIGGWILNVPLLYPEDVVVDVLNQRYKVVGVSRRTKSQYIIRQLLNLSPLDKGHPAYLVDVDRTVSPE
jgi:signal peptidase I